MPIDISTKVKKNRRLEGEDLEGRYDKLLNNLYLYLEDEQMVKRAAVLLFHPNSITLQEQILKSTFSNQMIVLEIL